MPHVRSIFSALRARPLQRFELCQRILGTDPRTGSGSTVQTVKKCQKYLQNITEWLQNCYKMVTESIEWVEVHI